MIIWPSVAALLDPLSSASQGEQARPPLTMFKALLLSIWYDLSGEVFADSSDCGNHFRDVVRAKGKVL